MEWKKEYLDLVLVPCGLLLVFGYHLFLLYRTTRSPEKTVIGFEDYCRRAWVNKMMQVDVGSRSAAFTVISSNISAATFMASTSLALTSLIGTLVGSSSNSQLLIGRFIYGDTSSSTNSIKFISILACFLLAFGAFIQCARSFVHATFLISMPQAVVPEEYVEGAVIMGSLFWVIGLRAIYFASTLLLWVFGPIPMFVWSICMVMMLHILDQNKNPLHDFQQLNGLNPSMKITEEAPVVTAIEHRDRSHGKGSRYPGTQRG
ncbi:hypothetical protein Ancab_025508 [Ancistrocladus abbreviatus]